LFTNYDNTVPDLSFLRLFAYPRTSTLLQVCTGVILLALIAALQLRAWRDSPEEVLPRPVESAEQTREALPDFEAITSIEAKKDAFFSYFHAYIEEENVHILRSRERLLDFRAILAGGALLSPAERHALDLIAAEYRIPRNDLPIVDMVEELLLRVDIIPPSLALAQAATESAWGTSRFAKEGNNIFGQWCFDEGCGLIPGQRADDASHEVRAFASVHAAVKAYYRNLNSNPTYEYFRELRAHMRLHDKPLNSHQLADGLTRYSERGRAYVAEIRDMIRINELHKHDQRG